MKLGDLNPMFLFKKQKDEIQHINVLIVRGIDVWDHPSLAYVSNDPDNDGGYGDPGLCWHRLRTDIPSAHENYDEWIVKSTGHSSKNLLKFMQKDFIGLGDMKSIDISTLTLLKFERRKTLKDTFVSIENISIT